MISAEKTKSKRFKRLLASKTTGRFLILLAFLFGSATGGLIAAAHFGWVTDAKLQDTVGNANDDADADDLDAVAVAADGTLVNAEDADDTADEVADDDTAASDEEALEIPESLRADFAPDQFLISTLAPLGITDSLLPIEAAGPKKPLESVLSDAQNRMSPDFQIDIGLKDRVRFWFDVYTNYDSNHRIIHHSVFPWIVYKVVDVTYIINNDEPSHLWMRRAKADRLVKQEALKIRAALNHLAHRKNFSHLSEEEQNLADQLAPIGGSLHKQALLALRSVRVQTGQKDFFTAGLQISTRYLTTMEKIFRANKMPVELTRIPFVESSFNKLATSKVGASGIWQFMGGTGRKYMMVDGAIDERRSPFKATEAAAHLLKENHLILHHSWPLAVTAWNHGPTGLRKAMARAGSKDLSTIIAHYRSRSFDFASSNFYSEFLAALYAERYSSEIFGPLDREPNVELQVVKLARAVRFNTLLKVSGMTIDDFLSLNPELSLAAKKNTLLPRGFRLHVPESVLGNLDSLFAIYQEYPALVNKGRS